MNPRWIRQHRNSLFPRTHTSTGAGDLGVVGALERVWLRLPGRGLRPNLPPGEVWCEGYHCLSGVGPFAFR